MKMGSKYRLSSSAFQRADESGSQEPLSVFFLSVEGNDTEVKYFEGVRAYRSELGISVLIDIEVLRRRSKDTRSAPKYVIELLEEYISLRGTDENYIIQELTTEFTTKYSKEFIESFVISPKKIPKDERIRFFNELNILGFDIEYRKYLSKYDNNQDIFCIVIDRDQHSNIDECIQHCNEKNYKVFLTNPCFEFWLLLHLMDDVINKYNCEDLFKNKKLSRTHSYVSYEVSKIAKHGKKNIGFAKNYLHNIDFAIKQADESETTINNLITKIGTNIGDLFKLLRNS
jgi:hypothetical protein